MRGAIAVIFAVIVLAGCGADTMTAAATTATLKKQEAEQARKTLGSARQKIDAAAAQMQQSAQDTVDTIDKN